MTTSNSSIIKTVERPFENIALSFSGGGFRAASYGLGVLSYFDKLKFNDEGKEETLLRKVSYMSSASGGTIVTALYALYSVKDDFEFKHFYTKLFKALENDLLLGRALTILNDEDKLWDSRKAKSRNMINAFALAYDELLFDGKTLSALKREDSPTHLYEVCFNTTEFYRGLLFRQNIKLRPFEEKEGSFLYGNFLINLNLETSEKLKLSDILAASSCFPSGFEPIIFPNDFIHSSSPSEQKIIDNLNIQLQTGDINELKFLFGDLSIEQLKKNRDIMLGLATGSLQYKKLPKIGFMDGGITDNQGTESMMKANERRSITGSTIPPFDFMMANDVGSQFMDSYHLPEIQKTFWGSISINELIVAFVLNLIAGIVMLVFGFHPDSVCLTYTCIALGVLMLLVSGVFFGIMVYIFFKLYAASKKEGGLNLQKNFSPNIVKTLLNNLRKTRLDALWQMVQARVTSILILNTDVFLKRVRQLLYNELFDANKWSYKVKGNRAYDLALSNDAHRKRGDKAVDEPSMAIKKIAEIAFAMGTTLWFDQGESKLAHKQACIIACGQFTTCYNLLDYILRIKRNAALFSKLEKKYQDRLNELEEQLKDDYAKFQENPFFLYKQINKDWGVDASEVEESNIPFPKNFKDLF